VNVGNTSFANAVLQLLVYSPPFRNMFRELDELKRQRGAEDGETGGYATPLVDATVRFLEEFMFKEESHPAREPLQPGEGRTSGEDEEKGKEENVVGSFEPTYLYDAMNERCQLKDLLDGEDQDAKEFLDLYLAALDEELLPRLTSIRDYKSADHSIDSPISRMFRGTFSSTMDASNRLDSVPVENWQSLQLDIQPDSIQSVQDALVRMSWPQTVPVDPSGSSEASLQVLIQDLPPILVLHFKRFIYDAAVGGMVKINKPIRFAPELEIPLDITVPAARQSAPSRYTLYGVLYALPPWYDFRWWALFGRRAPSVRRWWQ